MADTIRIEPKGPLFSGGMTELPNRKARFMEGTVRTGNNDFVHRKFVDTTNSKYWVQTDYHTYGVYAPVSELWIWDTGSKQDPVDLDTPGYKFSVTTIKDIPRDTETVVSTLAEIAETCNSLLQEKDGIEKVSNFFNPNPNEK